MIDTSTVLLGAGVAGIAAAWGQVKTALTHLSSILVIRARIHNNMSMEMVRFLKKEWKPLPSGIYTFYGVGRSFRKDSSYRTVPFHVLNETTVMYKGWRFLILSADGQHITLTSIRGVVDFKALLSAALDTWEDILNTPVINGWGARRLGFHVRHIVGRDKSVTAGLGRPDNGNTAPDLDGSSSSNGDSKTQHDRFLTLDIDESFKYPRSDWEDVSEAYDPFKCLFYSDEVMQHAHEAVQWLDMHKWYAERMIPWRRGWLLHGVGGTGKSSLAKAMAEKMGLTLYWYHLSTLSDQEFLRSWSNMNSPCVVLFEDFDTVFDGRMNVTENKSLTFDCILGALSGVDGNHGIFTIITTNHIEKIDPALGVSCDVGSGRISTRPGRIDTVIELGLADEKCLRGLATTILRDWPEEIESAIAEGDGYTPVQFQELCIQKAFKLLADRKVEHGNHS